MHLIKRIPAIFVFAFVALICGVSILIRGYQWVNPEQMTIFPLPKGLIHDLYANFGVEFISIAISVIIIDRLNQRRLKANRLKNLKLQLASPSNDFALEALRQISTAHLGFLHNDFLVESKLSNANLSNAYLYGVNLKKSTMVKTILDSSNLTHARLHEAKLIDAKITNSDVCFAQFHNADLRWCNFSGSILQGSDFRGAWLIGTDFRGANLNGTFLRGANCINMAIFDETTTLPNGDKWNPDKQQYLIRLTQSR